VNTYAKSFVFSKFPRISKNRPKMGKSGKMLTEADPCVVGITRLSADCDPKQRISPASRGCYPGLLASPDRNGVRCTSSAISKVPSSLKTNEIVCKTAVL
jgi:hypothetical protein